MEYENGGEGVKNIWDGWDERLRKLRKLIYGINRGSIYENNDFLLKMSRELIEHLITLS